MKPVIDEASFTGRMWDLISGVLYEKLEDARTKLETCEVDKVPKYQARVEVIRELLNLPQTRNLLEDSQEIIKGNKHV